MKKRLLFTWLRAMSLLCLCAVSAAQPSGAADTVASPAFPLQASAHMRWSAPVTMDIWGRPLQVVQFESDWPLERLAAELSRGQRHFQVLTRLPGLWLLSGQWAGQHWLAQIRVDDRTQRHTSRGQMSRWQMSAPAAASNPALEALSRTPWLGPPVMQVRFTEQGQVVEHVLFPVTPDLVDAGPDQRPGNSQQAVQALSQHMEAWLENAGWQRRRAAALPAPPDPSWQLGGQTLVWQVHPDPHGSGLVVFVQHRAASVGQEQ